ncbi:IS110 family transposase [Lactococcus nasutitermitis]|uniref:IS110 family transposase n=1 Tax=Lactococcus nasutitermitis TaxID=1652957 RepID=A0ABV9JEV5_9LACT|nr:IS110 family transposase [Lactococcus nasutitermitis]
MLYVGIDVAKNKHDLAVIDEMGTIIEKNFRFENSSTGFHTIQKRLSCLGDSMVIALEDTGHYAYNLVIFLRKLGYTVLTYNALLIKEFVKSLSLRKTKTDVKDALVVIARKLKADTHPERFEVDESMQELKELTRYQNRLIQARSKNKSLYVRLLDIMFPEFARIVGNVHNQYVYELLTSYPTPQKIKRARFDSLLKIKRLSADKAKQIQETAQFTIGNSSPALQLELKQLISTIQHYDEQINEIQNQINEITAQTESSIFSITGIGRRLGAIILAEIKNIDNFSSPAQLQAFAGLEPSIYQSGQMDNSGRMVKRGSHYLRYALILAAQSICRYSPCFKAYLALKRSQGKHYNVAVSHAAKKLIRVIYHLLKTNQTFDETKLR